MRAARRMLAAVEHTAPPAMPRTSAAIAAFEIGKRAGAAQARREMADEAAEAYELGRQTGFEAGMAAACGHTDQDVDLDGVEDLAAAFAVYLAGFAGTYTVEEMRTGMLGPTFRAWLIGREDAAHTSM